MTKQNKYIIILILLMLAIAIGIVATIRIHEEKKREVRVVCVPNAEVAVEIGKVICINAYPDIDFEGCEWYCYYVEDREIWWVYCVDKENKGALGGGMPQLCIKKDNAQVVSIGLQA